MNQHDLLHAMGRFGLSEREALLYLALLRRGPATARELSRETHLDRVVAYRILDTMRGKGNLEVTAERPRRYAPVDPQLLFDRYLRRDRTALEQNEKIARELVDALPTLTQGTESEAPRFQVLTGTSSLYHQLREMVLRAEAELAVMLTYRSLQESFEFGMHQWLPRFLQKGGRFRLILESDLRSRHLLRRFLVVGRRYPLAEVRQLHPQPTRITIVDRREAIVFLVPEARSSQIEEIAVWTNNRDFVSGQLLYFNTVWESAGSATLKPPKFISMSEARPPSPTRRASRKV